VVVAEQAVTPHVAGDRFEIRGAPVAVLASTAVIVVLHEGAPLFAPVFVSVLLAYALEPFVVALTRLRMPRVIAAAVIYTILAAAAFGVASTAGAQITGFLDDLPKTLASMRQPIAASRDRSNPNAIDRVQRAVKELEATLDAPAPDPPGVPRVMPVPRRFTLRNYLMDAGVGLAGIGVRFFAIALLTFLLITAGDLFKRKLIVLAGPRVAEKRLTLEVIKTIDRQIERYLVVRLLISGIVGVATGTVLWLVGLDHAPVWGFIAGALNVVPYIGPSVACGAITAAAFLQFHELEPTLLAGGASVIVATLEGNLISPWLTSRAGELNTVAVFVSVLFWGWAWDVWGLVLAVPITVALKAAADHIEEFRPIGELLGR
jgi:predicted PurR-regulated permease PerM